jgi:hypothetical protein
MKMIKLLIAILLLFGWSSVDAQPADFVWTSPSKNSSESMPCGGGSIGMNVWVEQGDILLYVCRSGSFDENNTLLKAGRFRIRMTPKLNTAQGFRQILKLNDGYVIVTDGDKTVSIWADVFKPVVHIDADSKQRVTMSVNYESWRAKDRVMADREPFQTSYKFSAPKGLSTLRDSIRATRDAITFFHRNQDQNSIFDVTVHQQGLDSVKSRMYNPLFHLTFGGRMSGKGFVYSGTSTGRYADTDFTAWTYASSSPQRHQAVQIALATMQGSLDEWEGALTKTEQQVNTTKDAKASIQWWNQYWQRSFVESDGDSVSAELTRNYTLFRYMLGCNALSEWPTKFNGGLFTFDPSYAVPEYQFTPDYRNWGGGTHTAQNQRLVYWPMLKNGDYDALKAQLDFYLRILPNAELRSRCYWHHRGAAFTEQIENFGLPEYYEYGVKRPAGFDPGMQYNAWLEYTWDTALEFCQMALDANRYCGMDIERYIPLVQSSLDFLDYHYRYLARQRGVKELDGDGRIVLYPGSGCETFKMAYNSASTISALQTVTRSLLQYMQSRPQYAAALKSDSFLLGRIPDISFRTVDGHKVIAPAVTWGRINNIEPSMLYPVFPWRIYGVGKPNIDVARDTYNFDPFALKFRSHIGWKQDVIWAACLGLPDEAARLIRLKMGNGPFRFPAFWGPGYDWAPDHNWGGSGMIAMQEMLLQEADGKIILFPAWPKNWDVHFRLHASGGTIVEASLRGGKITNLKVQPREREKDVVCQ